VAEGGGHQAVDVHGGGLAATRRWELFPSALPPRCLQMVLANGELGRVTQKASEGDRSEHRAAFFQAVRPTGLHVLREPLP